VGSVLKIGNGALLIAEAKGTFKINYFSSISSSIYLLNTRSATPLRALFMLHTVNAGNGISATEMGRVANERITGALSHF